MGESVKSKNRTAQENELLCKTIAYNITVLIHTMVEMGVAPDFCPIDAKEIVSVRTPDLN